MLKELYEYRELLLTNTKKAIRGKYKASFLGILWSFINPLLQILVYAIVFPYLMRNTVDNYLVYLVTGIIPWTFFTTVILDCVSCIKNNAGLIKKVYFPRIILPLSCTLSALFNFFVSCIIIVVFCLVWRVGISWLIVFVPLIALIQMLLSFGLGLIMSACDAYVQDLEYITNFIIQMAMYGTPIIYSLDQFAESSSILFTLIKLNPLTTIMDSYRRVFLYHTLPDFAALGAVALFAVILLFIGILVFKKLEKGFAEQF